MSRGLAQLLIKAKQDGVNQGRQFQGAVYLLALDNVLQDYIPEERLGSVLTEIENESNRIEREVFSSVLSGDINDMGEKVVYEVEKIRSRRGMDKHADRVSDKTAQTQKEVMEELRL